ncbi:hydrophobic protein [Kitasatospora sp. NPDC052896]|uniref:hydrophobic protein n=1 Tax=Kitasatospora sp. NPDC052896 TaxID=3364061 RepID=UPI0037C67138
MAVLLLVLLLTLLLFGLGFAVKVLWWVAVIMFVLWLIGFIARTTDAAGSRSRWYRW